jgi:hypothetical protein
MKPFYWLLVVSTVFWWGMYAEMREIHQQAQLPMAVSR